MSFSIQKLNSRFVWTIFIVFGVYFSSSSRAPLCTYGSMFKCTFTCTQVIQMDGWTRVHLRPLLSFVSICAHSCPRLLSSGGHIWEELPPQWGTESLAGTIWSGISHCNTTMVILVSFGQISNYKSHNTKLSNRPQWQRRASPAQSYPTQCNDLDYWCQPFLLNE